MWNVLVSDIERSERFYDAVLGALDFVQRPVGTSFGEDFRCWHFWGSRMPRFYVDLATDEGEAGSSEVTIFGPSREAILEAEKRCLTLGGSSSQPAGQRRYGNRLTFGADLRDADGNLIHIIELPEAWNARCN